MIVKQLHTELSVCMYCFRKRIKRGSKVVMILGCVLKSDIKSAGQLYVSL